MSDEEMLILIGMLFGGSYGLQLFIIKRLNYTCGVVGKIKTFLKLVHPDQADALD